MSRLTIAVTLLLPLAAASAAPGIDEGPWIDGAWARATPGAATVGAAYFRVRSATDDRLIGISSPVAGKTELHEHLEQDGVMRMERIEDGVPVKAGQVLELRSGGLHVMLIDLKAKLRAGDHIPITLTFEKAGKRDVDVRVEPLGARGPSEDADQRGGAERTGGIGKRRNGFQALEHSSAK